MSAENSVTIQYLVQQDSLPNYRKGWGSVKRTDKLEALIEKYSDGAYTTITQMRGNRCQVREFMAYGTFQQVAVDDFQDVDRAVAYAKTRNKPVLVDVRRGVMASDVEEIGIDTMISLVEERKPLSFSDFCNRVDTGAYWQTLPAETVTAISEILDGSPNEKMNTRAALHENPCAGIILFGTGHELSRIGQYIKAYIFVVHQVDVDLHINAGTNDTFEHGDDSNLWRDIVYQALDNEDYSLPEKLGTELKFLLDVNLNNSGFPGEDMFKLKRDTGTYPDQHKERGYCGSLRLTTIPIPDRNWDGYQCLVNWYRYPGSEGRVRGSVPRESKNYSELMRRYREHLIDAQL